MPFHAARGLHTLRPELRESQVNQMKKFFSEHFVTLSSRRFKAGRFSILRSAMTASAVLVCGTCSWASKPSVPSTELVAQTCADLTSRLLGGKPSGNSLPATIQQVQLPQRTLRFNPRSITPAGANELRSAI